MNIVKKILKIFNNLIEAWLASPFFTMETLVINLSIMFVAVKVSIETFSVLRKRKINEFGDF